MDRASVFFGMCGFLIRPKILWVENCWWIMKYIAISSKVEPRTARRPLTNH